MDIPKLQALFLKTFSNPNVPDGKMDTFLLHGEGGKSMFSIDVPHGRGDLVAELIRRCNSYFDRDKSSLASDHADGIIPGRPAKSDTAPGEGWKRVQNIVPDLPRGSIVRGVGRGESYVVTGTYGDYAIAVRTIHITNPREWDVADR